MPAENQPGHHPPKEQDKPDLDAFAARLGTDPKAPTATNARKGAKKTAPAKAPTAKKAEKSTPAKAASRPAAASPKPSSAGPQTRAPGGAPQKKTEPAKPPAAAPAPSLEDSVHVSVPQPEPEHRQPEQHHEPPLVSLMLLPLRETVRMLEQLDKTLTERLDRTRR